MSDRIFGGIGLLLAALFIFSATQIELSFISDPVGPRVFPMIIAGLLAVGCIAIILRPDPEPEWPGFARLFDIAIAAGAMVAYALALPEIGFIAATAIASAFLTWRLGGKAVESLIAGGLISAGIWLIFHLILGLSLARGPWGF
ncbi:MAG: putative tricarboxylic transport membrane protein [Paracoccaceae bacterium]|jgi:putative tricarboxylic transport membrane protein